MKHKIYKCEIVHFALKLNNIVVNFLYGYNTYFSDHKSFLPLLSDFLLKINLKKTPFILGDFNIDLN